MDALTYTNGHPPSPDAATSLIDVKAEQWVLGSALAATDHGGVRRLAQLLTPDDYYRIDHQHLHRAMVALYEKGEPVLPYTIMLWLDQEGIGDFPASLPVELEAMVSTHIYLDHFAYLVKELATERRIRAKMASGASLDEAAAYIEKQRMALYSQRLSPNFRDWHKALSNTWDVLAHYDKLASLGPSPYRWPWPSWNGSKQPILEPLEPGILVMLAAAPRTGKTIYMECLADWWARQGLRVLFAHAELNKAEMDLRRTVRHSGVLRHRLRSGARTEEEDQKIMDACGRLAAWPGAINYLHTPGWTVDQLCRQVEIHVNNGQCDVLLFDYMDKLAASDRQLKTFGSNTHQKNADDVEQIKNLAERLELRVVVAAQLNKEGRKSSFQHLHMEDIDSSGQKTARVNVVALLWRDLEAKGEKTRDVKIKIDKNTTGPEAVLEQRMVPELYFVGDKTPERENPVSAVNTNGVGDGQHWSADR